MNIVLFLAIYCIISITLSSLVTYKIRYPFYKLCHLPPPNKMRWQTVSVTFLLYLFMILITFAIIPFYDSYGNETEMVVVIAFSLEAFLAALYTLWYFVHHKLYAELDLTIILLLTMYLNLPLHRMEISEELYFKAWLNASSLTYFCFMMVAYAVLGIIGLCMEIFPNSWEVLKEMWNGDEKKEKR